MEAPETLTKADLSRYLMERLEFGKADSDLLVNTFLESIIASLRAGEGVELRGFGSFRLRDRRARIGPLGTSIWSVDTNSQNTSVLTRVCSIPVPPSVF